jgi:hypothetical protein
MDAEQEKLMKNITGFLQCMEADLAKLPKDEQEKFRKVGQAMAKEYIRSFKRFEAHSSTG